MSRSKLPYSGPERRKSHVTPNIGSLKSVTEEASIDVQIACADIIAAGEAFLASMMAMHSRVGSTRRDLRARTARITGIDLQDAA